MPSSRHSHGQRSRSRDLSPAPAKAAPEAAAPAPAAHSLPVVLTAEFLGSLLLTFAILASRGTVGDASSAPVGGLVGVALTHAFTLAALAAALGPISGGHLNPAVTIAFMTTGQQAWSTGFAYIVAQLIGGIAGAGIAAGMVPAGVYYAAPLLCDTCTTGHGFLAEFMGAFVLVLVIFLAAVTGNADTGAFLAIGLALGVGVLTTGPISNACLNPQRALGGAIAAGSDYDWSVIWVYLIAPLVGGIVAGAAFTLIFQTASDASKGSGRQLVPGITKVFQ